MKAILSINLLLFALLTAAKCEEKQLLLQIEYIETDKQTAVTWLTGENFDKSGNELRKAFQELISQKKATIINSNLTSMSTGFEATSDSTKAEIYPTEYDPAEVTPTQITKDGKIIKETANAPTPTAFEERPIGSALKCTATYNQVSKEVNAEIHSTLAYYTGNISYGTYKDKFGEANIDMAQFYKLELETTIALKHNTYHLAAVMTPKGKDGKADYQKKVLVFIRTLIL